MQKVDLPCLFPPGSDLRLSPLYKTVLHLMAEKSVVLQQVKVEHSKRFNKNAIYINFPNIPSCLAFPLEFQYKERHLSIHEHYKKTKSSNDLASLSIAHYTETYFHPIDNKERVVHFYFNSDGDLLSIEIKDFLGSRRNPEFTKVAVSKDMEELIFNNRQDVIALFNELTIANSNLHTVTVNKANDLERRLSEISAQLNARSIPTYIEVARDFVNHIHLANSYAEGDYDNRYKLIEQHIAHLEKKLTEGQSLNEQQDREDEDKTEANFVQGKKKKQNQQKSTKHEKPKEYDDIIDMQAQLESIKVKLQQTPFNVQLLLQKDKLVDEAKLSLLGITRKLHLLKPHQKARLQEFAHSLQASVGLFEIFQSEFWKGNTEFISAVYPTIKHLINLSFLLELFRQLLGRKPKGIDEENTLKKAFDFLYRESYLYRVFLRDRGAMMICIPEEQTLASLLVCAYLQDNFFAYSLFLEHGMNPNSYGLVVDETQIPAIFVIALEKDPQFRSRYIQQAFKYNIKLNCKPRRLFTTNEIDNIIKYSNLRKETKQLIKDSRKQHLALRRSPEELKVYTEIRTLVEFCASNDLIDTLKLVQPEMNLEHAFISLAILLSKKTTFTRYVVPSNQHGFDIFHSKDLDLKTGLRTSIVRECYFSLFWHTKDETLLNYGKELLTNLQVRFTALKNEHPYVLANLYNSFYAAANAKKEQRDWNHWQWNACLLFLLFEDPSELVYNRLLKVICEQAAQTKISTNNPQNPEYRGKYNLALFLAQSSIYSQKLTKGPLFEHIVKVVNSFEPESKTQISQPRLN